MVMAIIIVIVIIIITVVAGGSRRGRGNIGHIATIVAAILNMSCMGRLLNELIVVFHAQVSSSVWQNRLFGQNGLFAMELLRRILH